MEENQDRICFSSEPALNYQNINENGDNQTSVTPKINSSNGLPAIEEDNIGKFYAVFWPKPKAYYLCKLMKVFSWHRRWSKWGRD